MPDDEEDLLRPSLAPDFDVRRFERPWDPTNLPFAAFFLGPLGAGILYARNYRFLGSPRHARICLIASIAVTMAFALGGAWLIANGILTTKDRLIRYGTQGFSGVVGLVLTQHQRGRFRAWEQLGDPARPLLWPAIGIGLMGALGFGLILLFGLSLMGVDLSTMKRS
ncbi:MAG: hypothetical protein IPN34_14060 [Planctomycetes bacterium]|nr:hypothetical protein [Planctomycetota bacterium]